jgi:hypothetical protein
MARFVAPTATMTASVKTRINGRVSELFFIGFDCALESVRAFQSPFADGAGPAVEWTAGRLRHFYRIISALALAGKRKSL